MKRKKLLTLTLTYDNIMVSKEREEKRYGNKDIQKRNIHSKGNQ